jgi:hypothetical protein
MSDQDLKQSILELAAIAKECPDSLQEKCFELLLMDFLQKRNGLSTSPGIPPPVTAPEGTDSDSTKEKAGSGVEPAAKSDSDLSPKDLHVKAKKFLEKYSLSIADLNQIFYKEGESILPLYEDLKTTKASESQIRIGLLQAFVSGIKSGDFEFDGEVVRKECQDRKCYDGGNFSANFKNNATLFDGFEKYDSKNPVIRLSEAGRQALSKAIGEMH